MIVLDASAALAVIRDEAGADQVMRVMRGASIGAVNHSEVVAKLIDQKSDPAGAIEELNRLRLDVRPFDQKQSELAGLLRERTRHLGLSLGDRACLALGISLGCPVQTADRSWKTLDLGIEILLIR